MNGSQERLRGAISAELRRLADAYARGVTDALAHVPSRGRHVNALQHAAGLVSARLDGDERAALTAAIDGYQAGRAPRATPLALLRHHARRLGVPWLAQQVYLVSAPRRAAGGGR